MRDGCLVVTDVDNTVYDWVSLWAGAFEAMIATLVDQTHIDRDEWLDAAHIVHVRRGSTECPSLVADMVASAAWPARVNAARVAPAAAASYRDYWDHHLAPYAGVREALMDLAAQGHTVVAYTEGDVSIAASRVARMGLAGVIRCAFGRAPLPQASVGAWSLVNTARSCPLAVDFIPREDNKPNPAGLRSIIARCGASPAATVYVGDNLFKDVAMARAVGAGACWARYGTARRAADVALLARVAHWTASDTRAERGLTEHTLGPDIVLDDPRALSQAVAHRTPAAQ